MTTLANDKVVTYDRYSIFVAGKRVYVYSGEFHPFRLPSPALWKDVLQKMRSAGYTAVSIYVNWGYHSPKPHVYDYSGIRSWDLFLTQATEVGIYVIFRPGPYINAETAGGGLPPWLSTTVKSQARSASLDFRAAWVEYLGSLNAVVAKHQVTYKGGKVDGCIIMYQLENEFSTSLDSKYMEDLKNFARKSGIYVPLFHNDAWNGGHWCRGEGELDMYAWDGYPNLFDATEPNVWHTPSDPRDHFFNRFKADAPMFIAEFQGGAMDTLHDCATFENCRKLTDYDFERVHYKNNIAAGVTMQNFYMTYGGTNWGHSAKTCMYTSYDYGAAITEDRRLTNKYYESKLIAHFLAVAREHITKTEYFAADQVHPSSRTVSPVVIHGFRNLNTGVEFRVIRHADPSKLGFDKSIPEEAETSRVIFGLSSAFKRVPWFLPDGGEFVAGFNTAEGEKGSVIRIGPRQSKLLVAYYPFESQFAAYCTSDILTHISTGEWDVLVTYAEEGEYGEIALRSPGEGVPTVTPLRFQRSYDCVYRNNHMIVNFRHEDFFPIKIVPKAGSTVKPLLLLSVSRLSAYRFWKLNTPTGTPVLIRGPYLVRSVSHDPSTNILNIVGDLDAPTVLEVWSPLTNATIAFNGIAITESYETPWLSTAVSLAGPPTSVALPKLADLKWTSATQDAELAVDFDDSKWPACDKTTSFLQANSFENPVLFCDDYGFHTGHINYRGHFTATGAETGITLTANGGDFYVYGVWLNTKFLGLSQARDTASTFEFPADTLRVGRDNVIYVLIDHMGRDDCWDASEGNHRNYRGIKHAAVRTSDVVAPKVVWRVQGNLGGEDVVDVARGAYGVGGLYGERRGWHLPGFVDAKWGDLSTKLTPATVAWARTSFTLNIPATLDAPISVVVGIPIKSDPTIRLQFYVNGWLFGRYFGDVGPQSAFPVPAGILNPCGQNTFAVVVWTQKGEITLGDVVKQLSLKSEGVFVFGGEAPGMVPAPGYDASVYEQ